MSFQDISKIAGSAMAAQTVRLNTIASNLANADSAAGSEGETYRARKPVFSAVMDGPGASGAGGRVQVLDVVQSDEPLRKVYEPGHPMANADGMVFYPNVNQVAEMTDMMSASRAFETNVEVLGRIKSMLVSFIFGSIDALKGAGLADWMPAQLLNLPLSEQGLAWLVPSVMVLGVAVVIDRMLGKHSEAIA